METDVLIVGAGPAGSVCAALCAQFGLKTLLVERVQFPRDKVCGDSMNPACHRILDRVGATKKLANVASGAIHSVEFTPIDGRSITIPASGGRFFTLRRRDLDQALLECAIESGAGVETATVSAVAEGWRVETSAGVIGAKILVAADGRNSLLARSLGMQPESQSRERAAFQTHCPIHPGLRNRIRMRFFPKGYAGFADIGADTMTVCVVSNPGDLEELKMQVSNEFEIPTTEKWRSIAPISRRPALQSRQGVFLVGDAARVVEPFTGEGIYYAMRSGELAAEAVRDTIRGKTDAFEEYRKSHQQIYQNRLWINDFTRFCVKHPWLGSKVVNLSGVFPGVLQLLTNKVLISP